LTSEGEEGREHSSCDGKGCGCSAAWDKEPVPPEEVHGFRLAREQVLEVVFVTLRGEVRILVV